LGHENGGLKLENTNFYGDNFLNPNQVAWSDPAGNAERQGFV